MHLNSYYFYTLLGCVIWIMVEVFKCDHCSHFSQDAETMRLHEIKCEWNEANKTCFTCEHSGCDINNVQTCELNVKIEGRINKSCGKWVQMFDYS